MINFVAILLFTLLTIGSVSLLETYSKISRRELKRRANSGDELASALWKAVSYGLSLTVLLWGIIGLSAGILFVLLTDTLPDWLAVFGIAVLLWLAFAWLPNTRVSRLSERIAKMLSPYVGWFISKSYPILNKIAGFIHKHSRITVHSGIYQKEDLIELLDKQQHQADNRMTGSELHIVKHALTFSDLIIRDVMTPKRVIKFVNASDSVGPVLMDELHDSGFSRFPVTDTKEEKSETIVGTLFLRDLVNIKSGGTVASHMNKKVYYVNEEKPLGHALQAFLRTKHHLFMVVNEFEEIVGLITIEDVLEKVLGKQIIDEFDKYDDLRAVAALQAKKEAKNHTHVPSDEAELENVQESKNKN